MEKEIKDDVYVDLGDNLESKQETMTETAPSDEGQTESGNQEYLGGKFKSSEELEKAYTNLEKKLGEQGRLLGEYKQKVNPKEDKLKKLEELENKVFSSDFDPYDEDNKKLQREYNKLSREYSSEMAESRLMKQIAQKENLKVVENFDKSYEGLSESEKKSVVEFAQSRLADANGAITKGDLEASLLRLNPDKYNTYVRMKAVQDEQGRMANAINSHQPRISSSNTQQTKRNVSQILRENPDFPMSNPIEWKKISRNLSDEDLLRLTNMR